MLDALVEWAFWNANIVVIAAYLAAIGLSWKRIPATVPFLPGLYVTGAMFLGASLFYFFAVPDPSTPVERLLRQIGDAVFFGIAVLGVREAVKIKRG
ncbi:hypothetical protein KY092_08390 [Natronomonas gomsonensis]|uniref:hypothetical protein n=1 Tax=Natronomonas gomsonensis TaxID=1046043 RepID=UPI0020CA8FF9|nr:hypothetical protein [Natronomonas gomsonensis]MCY4730576.1 hypothetical protein [Natronomonas gomsonensis]